MTVKQSLNAILEYLSKISIDSETYCPTSDDIKKNDRVSRLAKRLKASSDRETLTNIVEWEERNIVFWTERHPLVTVVWDSIAVFAFGLLILSILTIMNFMSLPSYYWSVVLLYVIWGSCVATTLSTMTLILHSNRKFSWKDALKGLMTAFTPSIPMDFLLDKKLGVCRDYAKLTACLLARTYPNGEIYFATAPAHVATGIKIGNELYMLDQRLPILTKDRWNDYRKPRWYHTIKRFDLTKMTLHKADKKAFMRINPRTELDSEQLRRLSKRMIELLNMEERSADKIGAPENPIEIPWENGAILYEENEMTDYSLARYLATRLSAELIRTDRITKIETNREKDDLKFQIHFGDNERALGFGKS